MLIVAGVLSLLAAVLFGAMPALHVARSTPTAVMHATAGRGQSQGRAAGRVNDTLVVAEIAMLLAGAGLVLKSLWKLTRLDLRMNTEQVLTLHLSLRPGRYDSTATRITLLQRIEARIRRARRRLAGNDRLPSAERHPGGLPYGVEGKQLLPGSSQVISTRTPSPRVELTVEGRSPFWSAAFWPRPAALPLN